MRRAVRLDVLVEAQHIVGVVLLLDLRKASIVRTVAQADKLVTRVTQLIDVDSIGEGLQGVAGSLDPSHYSSFFVGSIPNPRYVYFITRLPQSKRHSIHTHTADCPAQRHDDQLACCGSIVDGGRNCRNCRTAEISKNKVSLEVRNRGQKKTTRGLSVQI